MTNCKCGGERLIYACSGAADVGELADKVARSIRDEKFARMTCLAGIGAKQDKFMESAKDACANITIDGCPVACAKKSLEKVGIEPTFGVVESSLNKISSITPYSIGSLITNLSSSLSLSYAGLYMFVFKLSNNLKI